MNQEFKKIKSEGVTRYVLESGGGATSGGTSSASVGSGSYAMPIGRVQRRKPGQNLINQEAKEKEAPKPRNFVAKNAKMGGAGAHKDKKKDQKQGIEKHKKPYAEGVAEGAQLDEGAMETISNLVKKLPGIGKYYQIAQEYKPQLVQILKTSKSGKEVKQKMEALLSQASTPVAESGLMKQLGGLALGGGSILSTMWMNAMGMIDGVLAHSAAGEVGGAVASGSILALIPVTLMLFAAMLLFKGSKQSSDEKAQAVQAQRGQQGVAEDQISELSVGPKIRAYAGRSDYANDADHYGDDDETEKQSNKADKIRANILRKHGDKAAQHADRAATSRIAGRFHMQPMKEGDGGEEYNDEVGMADSNIHTIIRSAKELINTLEPMENMPEWAQDKLAQVKGMLVSVKDYIESQHEHGNIYHTDEDLSVMENDLASMFAQMAKDKGMNVRVRGTPDQERQRTQDMLAQRRAEQEKQSREAGIKDFANIDQLEAEYAKMKAEYQSLGGSNWQYADREQNLSASERKARSMEDTMNRLWQRIQRAKKYGGEGQAESAPPGWKGTVKAMKKHKDIDNPFALAWSMKNKGYKSHKPNVDEDAYIGSLLSQLEERTKK